MTPPTASAEALPKAVPVVGRLGTTGQDRVPAKNTTQRLPVLDFTKGALVLTMVVYHWLNYFYSSQGDVYRYLRFLTPSFIFITGFLISNIYLSKYRSADSGLSKRLAQRGLKLIAVFVVLNLGRMLMFPESSREQMLSAHSSISSLVSAIHGDRRKLGRGTD